MSARVDRGGRVWVGQGRDPMTRRAGWWWWADEWGREDDAPPDFQAVGPFNTEAEARADAADWCGIEDDELEREEQE